MTSRRLVVGISGASGIVYGVRALQMAREAGVQTHLVVSKAGDITRALETELSAAELRALADVSYSASNVGASIASGSFRTIGMLIAPCSANTLCGVARGDGSNLLTRAADVTLKERRRLVLMLRETPLSLIHCRAITAVTEAGGIVAPPVPAFYTGPQSIGEIVDHSVARALELLEVDVPMRRWGEPPEWAKTDARAHDREPLVERMES